MRFGSVCSGIEAASVAWNPLGWHAEFVSEIEPFPCSLLKHHYPAVPNHGDMTKFSDWPDHAIDLLAGGTPCQTFSVAGLRGGLADPRGNLMLTFGAIAARYRPRWLVWENVPGVLSSNGGRDFGSFLGLLGHLGYGFAYRVLDAQYFGLAQRRKRVFVVACLGDWRSAAAVLFEPEGLRGDPAPSREAGQRVAACFDASFGRLQGCSGQDANHGHSHLVAHAFDARQSDVIQYGDKTGPLDTDGSSIGVLAFDTYNQSITGEVTQTLCSRGDSPGGNAHLVPAVQTSAAVRRLTPRECERLQGFPDDYTQVPHRKKPAADGPRYKALGNSWAVPVARWIGRRIELVDAIKPAACEEAA